MNYKCYIIDDEPLARKIIKEYLVDIKDIVLAGESDDPVKAIEELKIMEIDILFLDINMPKISGLKLAEQLSPQPLIVFTTAYPEYAVEAFELQAFDYLVKPIAFDRFLKTCTLLKEKLNAGTSQNEQEFIVIKEGKRLYKVDVNEVLYIKAFGDYVRVFTNSKTYITKIKFNQYLLSLPKQFVQIHRSFSVNPSHIDYLEGNHLSIKGEKIPVSAGYKQVLISHLSS